MEFNNNEIQNNELQANQINDDELDVSGGRIIEVGEGDKKEYFVVPDHAKSFKTKEEAEKAEAIFKRGSRPWQRTLIYRGDLNDWDDYLHRDINRKLDQLAKQGRKE